jgi:hypothetical protein
MIHDATNAAMKKALRQISKLNVVKAPTGNDPRGKF